MTDKPPIGLVLEHYGWDGRATGYGPWRTTRCPVHQDRHPSARVNEDEEVFRCFACEINGDAYTLVMAVEGCDFLTAREKIKEITGYESEGSAGKTVARTSGRQLSSRLPMWARERHGLARGPGRRLSGSDSRGR